VRRSSVVRHLREMTEQATDLLRLRETAIGWPLDGIWVAGELLTDRPEIEEAAVVLMLDLPPRELPWLAINPTAEWVSDQLRLGKRPINWVCRPRLWPPWNPANRRVARIWAMPTGAVEATLSALEEGTVAPHAIVVPSLRELRKQSEVELEVSRRHLHGILDRYWDRRDRHRDLGSKEDRLWRAAQGVRELEEMVTGPDELAAIAEIAARRRASDLRPEIG
jgi:hypothetical protein